MSAKNRGAVVAPHEFYPTPRKTVESLIDEVVWPIKVKYGDPCAGDSAIIVPFVKNGITEPKQWEWAEIREGRDYLNGGMTGEADIIITNPPFSLATDFLDQTFSDQPMFAAYLLRLNFWGSRKRKDWWQGKEPTHQFTLSERPSFTGKGTDATEYCWFVWDRAKMCKRPPGMYAI